MMLSMSISRDKVLGCFLLGACGDALGAPIEITRLPEIRALYGQDGLAKMIPHINAFNEGIDYAAGSITDDTTMTMTVVAALRLSAQQRPVDADDFDKTLGKNLWQAYLNWGQHQDDRPEIAAKIDKTIPWPEDVKNFWFRRGAGRGTIAALCQDYPGSFDRPQVYDMMIRGKKTQSPNPGCGGMMRIAPFAFLPVPEERLFDIACQSACITNGHPDAYVAAGATALLVRHAARDVPLPESLDKIKAFLHTRKDDPRYSNGLENTLKAITAAEQAFAATPNSLDAMDGLPRLLGHDNPFKAVPVLAQVVYAALHGQDATDARRALRIAVNHGGDSDSVGAIVGNILGAQHGPSAIPTEWLDALQQKQHIADMAKSFSENLSPPAAKKHSAPKP
jgi:ADP-ribosylglycohydrolase